ncbi:unnamed protein product [Protopolystoma xenopodis]|uniref:Uncharacterized protein n=1 Tax=Protopolystoma xenopodis TaxID=117903 RepID=A0A3S5C8F4_9PLAT|nr:unnamed protein product [Protopolystoma xenopodis]
MNAALQCFPQVHFEGLLRTIQQSSLRCNPPSVSDETTSRIPSKWRVLSQHFIEEFFETQYFLTTTEACHRQSRKRGDQLVDVEPRGMRCCLINGWT